MTGAGERRLLLLSMYPLDTGTASGPTVRITHLRDQLARRVRLEVVSGARWSRGWALIGYVAQSRLRGLSGVYVESSTALPGPIDLLVVALARLRRIPVLTYIRDAYQLFPEYYVADSWKRRISRAAFRPSIWLLARASTNVAFPSCGLANAVLRSRVPSPILLPPGSPRVDAPPVDPAARTLLYVGGLAHEAQGGTLLLKAVEIARSAGADIELICVTPSSDVPAGRHPSWLRYVKASGSEILDLLPEVLATVTPRRATPYNHLAVPIKVLEYLGYARPLIVTDCEETAAIVRGAGCGVVVPDTAAGLAAGISEVVSATPNQITDWGEAARRAALANSWDVRADRILELLGVKP